MDDAMRATIDTLVAKVGEKTRELSELKRTINFLAREAGGDPVYPDEAETSITAGGLLVVRPDEFYGKSPITAAREYLEKRGRAVPAEEILSALERGGFDFDGQGWKLNDRLRALSVSLSKNSQIFHRLPNGTYGLLKFYDSPRVKKQPKRPASQSDNDAEGTTEATDMEGSVQEGN